MLGLHTGVPFGLELLELLGDLGPDAAGDLVPPPGRAVRAVAQGDRGVPAAPGLVLVDRSFVALTTPGAEAEDFKAKVQQALEDAEAQMARTRAMLLGALPGAASPIEAGVDTPPVAGRSRRKEEAYG